MLVRGPSTQGGACFSGEFSGSEGYLGVLASIGDHRLKPEWCGVRLADGVRCWNRSVLEIRPDLLGCADGWR